MISSIEIAFRRFSVIHDRPHTTCTDVRVMIQRLALANPPRCIGNRTATQQPSPGFEVNCMRPPNSRQRLSMFEIPVPPVILSSGLNPVPLSSTVRTASRSAIFRFAMTAVQREWRAAL
jgi:hypothetical protein